MTASSASNEGPVSLARAAVIAVGSELLTPLRSDTNSLHITEQLNRLGIEVVLKMIVGDDRQELADAFHAARQRTDLVVTCGGLGRTDDDITREVVAEAMGRTLSEEVAITEQIRARFVARGFTAPMPEINRRQAMVPSGARVLPNSRGSAPGLWLEDARGVVLLLPGPPREMMPMLAAVVAGPLHDRAAGRAVVVRRAIKITGRVESQTDEALQPLYRQWAQASLPIAATILAALGQIEVHLSVRAATVAEAESALDTAVMQATGVLGADAYSTDGRALERVVGDLLVTHGFRIALAESCTGGLITSRLTDVPGSSRYVRYSVIAYSNDAKTGLLGVAPELLAEHGAVSEPVALAMADGIRAQAGVDVGVGVTGIAGPDGGSADKPVGTVAIAAVTAAATRSRVFRFMGEREQVKFQASQAALDMVRRMLIT
jgi:nicotinamide-nucleotide amidase